MNILQDLGHDAQVVGKWLSKEFKSVEVDGDKIAIAITEGIQSALKSGVVTEVADVIEAVFPGVKNLPTEIVAGLNVLIPKILASELALQGLPANATPQDVLDFEQKVLAAFNVVSDKSKLYTTLAAQVYGLLLDYQKIVNPSFADKVNVVENAFKLYVADKAAA